MNIFFNVSAGALLACAILVAPVHAEAEKCTFSEGDNDVAKACKEGGLKRATTVMKTMTKAATKKGMKTTCADCHIDEETWKLTKNGQADFEKMLKLLK